ncbi:MAG: TPM domain-containing protein [Nitrospirae bacterium]|nr:TPM domain-containing protein [Nitrospirota bacterium]
MRSYSARRIHKHLLYSAVLFLLFIPAVLFAETFPQRPSPPRLVNDYTNTLKPEEQEVLERKLVEFDNTTSTQIVIVILETLDGYPIGDYTVKLGEEWGVGQKDKNNGAVVLAAMKDREVFIATGYGLEGAIPDALAKRIVEFDIKPYFKQGLYYEGLDRATDSMIALAKGEYTAERHSKPGVPIFFRIPWFFIIFVIIFFIIMLSRARRYRGIASNNNVPFWMALILANMGSRHHRGKWDDFSSGGGGFGGGSGGFGGFGGGSFGGGGAGGRW